MKKRIVFAALLLISIVFAFAETSLVFLGENLVGSPDHLVATLQANGFDYVSDKSSPGNSRLCGYLNGILTDVEVIYDTETRRILMVVVRNNTPDYNQQGIMYDSQLAWMTKQYGKPVYSGKVGKESYARWRYSDSIPSGKGNTQDIVLKMTSDAYVEIFFRESLSVVFPGYWDIVEAGKKTSPRKFMSNYTPLKNPYESITNQQFADSRLDQERAEKRAKAKENFDGFIEWTKNLFKKKDKPATEEAVLSEEVSEDAENESEAEETEVAADTEAEIPADENAVTEAAVQVE